MSIKDKSSLTQEEIQGAWHTPQEAKYLIWLGNIFGLQTVFNEIIMPIFFQTIQLHSQQSKNENHEI